MKNLAPNSKLLVILPKFIGDSVNTLPAIDLLQQLYPHCQIYAYAQASVIEVIKHAANLNLEFIIDKKFSITKPESFRLMQQLRAHDFQIAVILRTSYREALLCRFAGIPQVLGYDLNLRRLVLHKSLKLDVNDHYLYRYCRLINELHGEPFEHYQLPRLAPPQQYPLDCNPALRKVAVSFGGGKGNRHYPFTQALAMLLACHQQQPSHFYFVGAPFERESAQALAQALSQLGVEATDLTGETSLAELVDILAQVDLMLCTDSGPMHIACACGTATIAFVGKGTSPWSIVAPKQAHCIGLLSRSTSLNSQQLICEIMQEDFLQALAQLSPAVTKDHESDEVQYRAEQ